MENKLQTLFILIQVRVRALADTGSRNTLLGGHHTVWVMERGCDKCSAFGRHPRTDESLSELNPLPGMEVDPAPGALHG